MMRLVLAPLAESDLSLILTYLRREAGTGTAEKYRARFRRTFDQLRRFPESGAPRPDLSAKLRIAVIHPYVIFYDFDQAAGLIEVWRVLHGKASVDERLMRGS
jgi:plasmid stabilization system protein ParE